MGGSVAIAAAHGSSEGANRRPLRLSIEWTSSVDCAGRTSCARSRRSRWWAAWWHGPGWRPSRRGCRPGRRARWRRRRGRGRRRRPGEARGGGVASGAVETGAAAASGGEDAGTATRLADERVGTGADRTMANGPADAGVTRTAAPGVVEIAAAQTVARGAIETGAGAGAGLIGSAAEAGTGVRRVPGGRPVTEASRVRASSRHHNRARPAAGSARLRPGQAACRPCRRSPIRPRASSRSRSGEAGRRHGRCVPSGGRLRGIRGWSTRRSGSPPENFGH
jgi:hypothetical protein